MRYLFLLIFIFLNFFLYAQEICNNGRDDDNDGLIDLKDPDCLCKDSLPVLNYIRNASFENYGSCPVNSTQELYLVNYWNDGHRVGSGVDYYNLNCEFKYYDDFGRNPLKPPLPLPDGNGYVGMWNAGENDGFGEKEYAATCLVNPLQAGVKYSFECFIGFSPDDKYNAFFKSPAELGIYGHTDCSAYPFGNVGAQGCPLNVKNNWVQLGTLHVYGKANWVKARIDFVPAVNINAFLVGHDCENYGPGYQSYFYADDFSLSEEKNFSFKTITVNNNNCSSGLQLKAPPAVKAMYQWYKDSIAIISATDSVYAVPNTTGTPGNYNVRLLFSNTCIISSPLFIDLASINTLNLGKDTTLCSGEKLLLKAKVKNVQYRWQDGSTDSNFLVRQPGKYVVQITNNYGCTASDSITVNFKQCTDCAIQVPTAFTPNGDGLNDVFKVLTSCPLIDNFNLQIFNRWGQKLFETKNVSQAWEGKTKNKPLPMGIYIYTLQYKKYGTPNIEKRSGTITLLR